MDQDETGHAGRPRGHIVLDGEQLLLPKRGTARNSAHICCGQIAGWIKIPLGMEVGFGPGDFVLDGTQLPSLKRGGTPSPIFAPSPLWPNDWMDQYGTWHRGGPWSRPHCARWGPSYPPQKRTEPPPQFSAHFYCGHTVGCTKMPLGMEVGLSPGDCVRWEPSHHPRKGGGAPQFSAHVYCDQTTARIKMLLGTELGHTDQATLC